MKKTSIVKIILMLLIIALFSTTVYAVDEPSQEGDGTSQEEGTPNGGSEKQGNNEEDGDDDPEAGKQEETEEWTDFSGVSIELIRETYKVGLDIKNVPNDKLMDNSSYYVLFSNQKEIQISESELENRVATIDKNKIIVDDMKVTEFLENNGNIYATIVQQKVGTNECKKIFGEVEIKRPALLPLGSRIQCYFFNDDTSTYFKEMSISETRKINIKIGEITDKNILLSIKNGEANCLQKLLNYAKTAESICSTTVPVGRSSSITSNMNLVNDKYYYVYMEMDDEDGKYYPVEDVSLYQALVDDEVGKELFDYLSGEFKWNLENDETGNAPTTTDNESQETEKKDETTSPKAIPATGIKSILMVIVALTGIAVFCSYKYNKWKGIK